MEHARRSLNAAPVVRHGDAHDHEVVRGLGRRTVHQSVSALRPADAAPVRASYDRLLEFAFAQSHVLLVADFADEPAGFLLLLDALPDEVTSLTQGFVAYMAVEPQVQRHGVGAALLEAAETLARARGLPHLALMVTDDNVAARELYAQAGYVTERRLLCKAL